MSRKRITIQAFIALLFLIGVFISAYVAKSIPTQPHHPKENVQVEGSIYFADMKEAGETGILDVLNDLAKMSEETEVIKVKSKLYVGIDEDVKPGVYDVEFFEGSGEIIGERRDSTLLTNAWKVDAGGKEYASTIRIILFEGDFLGLPGVSKVKFNPVPIEVEPINELGVGEFIVGRDVDPGEYTLSSNVALDSQLEDVGWTITIIKVEEGLRSEQMLTATTEDIDIQLKEGHIISLAYEHTDELSFADEARIILMEK